MSGFVTEIIAKDRQIKALTRKLGEARTEIKMLKRMLAGLAVNAALAEVAKREEEKV